MSAHSPPQPRSLGQSVSYPQAYDATLLEPIARSLGRGTLGLGTQLPFAGSDSWTAYELAWLDASGKPQVAIGLFTIPADSPFLIESKSLKLYLNSLNSHRFPSPLALQQCLQADLSKAAGATVDVAVHTQSLGLYDPGLLPAPLPGVCLDAFDLPDGFVYPAHPEPALLRTQSSEAPCAQRYQTDLFRSLCPVTAQPDWASVYLEIVGPKICERSLLAYLLTFRQHQGFHEQCVEQIFLDVQRVCQATQLSVYARFTRRGGLDINPFRSNCAPPPRGWRTLRQ